ncbi:MAG: ATP-binding protein [Rhodopila sp.]|nr:ATP-binding protein [Rhodopila sp.]
MTASRIELGDKRGPTTAVVTLRRLKIALVAAVVLPLVLLIAGAWDERVQLLDAADGEALGTVAALREHALKAIETHELLLRELDHRIQGMSWDQIRSSSAALSADIRAMHAGMPQVSLMAATDAEGRIWDSNLQLGRDEHRSIAQRDFWSAQREADQGTFFSHAYVDSRTGGLKFGISRRRTAPDGSFDGTVHVVVAASYFSDFWSEVIAGKDGAAIALVRTDGEVLARFPDSSEPLPIRVPQASPLLRHLAAAERGGVYRVTSTIDGVKRIYAYARVGPYPLVVGFGLSEHSVLAPWRLHLLVLGGLGAVASCGVALAVLAAIRQVRNLTEEQARRAAIEDAMLAGQRMELLGQFTVATAHDFANILQAVQSGADLISRGADEPERVRFLARRLGEDAERGASLTHRMLDLVRRNHGQEGVGEDGAGEILNPAEAIAGVSNLLSRILGSTHQLRCQIEPDRSMVPCRGNRIDLEVAVMNLVVNARDAMPNGGEVVIRAAVLRVGGAPDEVDSGCRGATLTPGLYVRVSVTDHGIGMAPDVLARAGERFFTTKPSGQGTGLGLAGAREFAERAGGKLSIETELGRGTTVTLWLPSIDPCPAREPKSAEPVGS